MSAAAGKLGPGKAMLEARSGPGAFRKTSHLHFVGIGGTGMCGIAEVLLNMGFRVTGSDLKRTPVTERLEMLGGRVAEGHRARNVHGADVVVVSTAVKRENVEVVEARRLAIPVIPRAEMLAELMRMKYGVAVAGSHGKTSTTSMVAHVLAEHGFDPTVVIGGRLGSLDSHARLGQGELMVAEADESDGSFLHLSPTIAVVTNIDLEHLDHYGSMDRLRDAFADFLNKVPFYGAAVICLDDPEIQALMPRLHRRLLTYGTSTQADLSVSGIEMRGFGSRCDVTWKGSRLGSVTLAVPGRHSIQNSLAALAVAMELDIPFEEAAGRLSTFGGADRRFQLRGTMDGDIMVVDDYAHHPTEIRATLTAAKEGWDRRIIAIFQPHRYSRLQALMEEFATSFYEADVVIVTPVYPAGEDPIPGVDAETIRGRIVEHGHRDVRLVESLDEALALVRGMAGRNDIVLTMGAGDVNRICRALVEGHDDTSPKPAVRPRKRKGR
jgi:UDP-N-acetylmuramate--alanine ligase